MAEAKKILEANETEFVEFLRENPDLAAEMILIRNNKPLRLTWYQRLAIREAWTRSFYMMIWNRGAAKTTTLAIICILKALLYPGHSVLIFAASYRQAIKLFDEIIRFYVESPILQESCIKAPSKTPISCELMLKHGARIKALPLGDGSKILGERGNTVVIDETARVPSQIIDVAIMPMLNVPTDPWETAKTQNSLIMGSTAYWQFNHLYSRYVYYLERVKVKDKRYGVSTINLFDCPPGWLDIDVIKQETVTMTRLQWVMENLSIFPSDSDGFYPASLLESVRSKEVKIELEGKRDGIYVAGVDPARHGANFVIAVIKILGDKKHLVYMASLHREKIQTQVNLIRDVVRRFNVKFMVIDAGGGGLHLKDELSESYQYYDTQKGMFITEQPIIDVQEEGYIGPGMRILLTKQFSDKDNTEINFYTKANFENKVLLLPDVYDDSYEGQQEKVAQEIEEMNNEFLNIVAAPLSRGFFHFDTPTKTQKKDRYSAVLMANYAAKEFENYLGLNRNSLATGFAVTRDGEIIYV